MDHTEAKVFTVASLALALVSCGQAPGQNQWHEVRVLDAPHAQIHLVVIEPAFARDDHVYQDAAATLCPSDGCSIEFFPTTNAVPKATTFADYRDGGYSADAPVSAIFGRKTFFASDGFAWDCNRFPQRYLNSCIPGTDPVPTNSAAAQQRGPLDGFKNVNFGMALQRVVVTLGGADAVSITGTEGDENVHGKVDFQGRKYLAVYGMENSHLSSVLIAWSNTLGKSDCVKQVKSAAEGLKKEYGEEDGFNSFIPGDDLVEYKWYFANGGRVSLSNVGMTDGYCSIYVNFDSKRSLERTWQLHQAAEQR